MTARRMSRQDWSDQVATRVAAAQELLAQKLTELRSGQDWQRYLAFQARRIDRQPAIERANDAHFRSEEQKRLYLRAWIERSIHRRKFRSVRYEND